MVSTVHLSIQRWAKKMNPDQLTSAARRVLNGINQFLTIYFWKTALQPRLPQDPDLDLPYVALENACIDSSMVAMRAFEDFVSSNRRYQTDLIAGDFPGLTLSTTGLPSDERNKINQHIAHLTHLDLEHDTRSYGYRACLAAIITPAIEFCDHVVTTIPDEQNLHEFARGTKTVCEAVRDTYVN